MSAKLSDVAEQLVDAKDRLSEVNKQAEHIKAEIDQLEEHLRELMTEQGVSSIKVGDRNIRMAMTKVPSVVDWEAYYQYIRDNSAFYLLERRPAAKAWREEVEMNGAMVPGTEEFTKVSISMTRVG